MAKTNRPDAYTQYFGLTVVESGASTLTFQQLQTGGQLFERRAIIIHRVDYVIAKATQNLLVNLADRLEFGLSLSNLLTTIPITDPNIVDLVQIDYEGIALSTPATNWAYQEAPHVRDFSMLPGGGLIVPAFPLFGFVRGTSLGSAATIALRGYFTVKELAAEEFVELVQALRVIT